MVETNNEDKSQVEDVPSEVKEEEVIDSGDSPLEEEDNVEVEEELDSEGSLTVQFMATHELVKQLFTVLRKAQEEQLEVIGMQSDAMTVKYMFGLPIDVNAIEIEKITEIVDQEPTSTKLTLKYYEQSMQLDVLLNDAIVLQEKNYSTEDEDVKHYVSDKLNKFTALLESNIKKIKKERKREKEERKERKKLVSQLRDF